MNEALARFGIVEQRLATYGTLSPGQSNHHQVASLAGHWSRGTVCGRVIYDGPLSAMGYPGLILERAGPVIDVHLLHSADLPAHWARLDAFEGAGYRRIAVDVLTGQVFLRAYIYALALPQDV